jgi:homoserine dehydrogenase
MIRVGVLGAGVVGGGVIELLMKRGPQLGLSLARVAVRDAKKHATDIPAGVTLSSVDEVLSDASIDVVVELMGGLEPALSAVKTAIEYKKDVVTANKVLVAEHGEELRAAARARGVGFRYEASVAGCLPIVEILENGLIFDQVDRLFGILNGTCNFILTRCQRDGASYEAALKEAQLAGFAEPDPRLDVSGADTAQKLAILAELISGKRCTERAVSVEGIERLVRADHLAAEEIDCRIKLLASYVRLGDTAQLSVAPTLVPAKSALGLTTDEYNAVEVECTHIGWQLYLGKGAGRMPTAAAVMHDLEELSKAKQRGLVADAAPRAPKETIAHLPREKHRATWMVRIGADNPAWPMSQLGAVFFEQGIEIVEFRGSRPEVGSLLLTSEAPAGAVSRAAESIAKLAGAASKPVVLAMEPDA